MQRICKTKNKINIISHASVGGKEEREGPLGENFDFCDVTDLFGQKSFELAEGEMGRIALNAALSKANLSHRELDLLIAGDLQNQCVASSVGLSGFDIPFLGIYGACSTCTEALLILASMMDSAENLRLGAAVTTSHNSAAERQFRTPLEYGGQRAPTAQWTSTAGGAFILSREGCGPRIVEYMAGRVVDGGDSDGGNMGGAMAFAAADSIISYFEESGRRPSDFDFIVTGDLGKVGSAVLRDILSERLPTAAHLHTDCGLILYDTEKKDVHSGASGCGTSASVLSASFLPRLANGTLRRILFLSTGALMSPSSLLQGKNIYGIAPLINIESELI